jgi:dynein light chain LC8-type
MGDDGNIELLIDMPESSDMINDAKTQAKFAVENYKIEAKISQHIKRFFDEKYGPNWHCVIGKHFNSYVSYESKHFIFFYEGQMAILLYKMG